MAFYLKLILPGSLLKESMLTEELVMVYKCLVNIILKRTIFRAISLIKEKLFKDQFDVQC